MAEDLELFFFNLAPPRLTVGSTAVLGLKSLISHVPQKRPPWIGKKALMDKMAESEDSLVTTVQPVLAFILPPVASSSVLSTLDFRGRKLYLSYSFFCVHCRASYNVGTQGDHYTLIDLVYSHHCTNC